MKATEILTEEHEVIEGVLDSLEAATKKAQAGQPVRPGFFRDAAEFIKGFADGCHHKKEEGVLFKRMVASGVPSEAGPIPVMLYEHEQGRAYTRRMLEAALKWEQGDVSAKQEVVENALGYTALLRQHIWKENNILFPLADRSIPVSQQEQVAEDFEHIEHEETGEGVHEKYLALANALEKEVGS